MRKTLNSSAWGERRRLSQRWTGGLVEFLFPPAAGGLAKSTAAKLNFFSRPAANSAGLQV